MGCGDLTVLQNFPKAKGWLSPHSFFTSTRLILTRFDIVDVPFLIQLQREFSNGIKQVVWMYDVNCKYSVNCYSQSFNNPYSPLEPMYQDFLKGNEVSWLVNHWHGYSHKPECGDKHSLRHTPNTGMVTGEEVETTWPPFNGKQYDAREMDAGGRQDEGTAIIVEHNRKKIEAMGMFLRSTFSFDEVS
jgi:Kyakuja-Dileera-Zisupton transposase